MAQKYYLLVAATLAALVISFWGCSKSDEGDLPDLADAVIVDHRCTTLGSVPEEWIVKAKLDLHIAYGHTSHGSQITDGMSGLVDFRGSLYAWNDGGIDNALDLEDYAMPGDLGNPDRISWAAETREYLTSHPDVNAVMWAWCGQVSEASAEDINTYLTLMSELENDFKNVRFVYMTGHLDGSGLAGNLNLRNEQIREYCRMHKKILFDFADIESYNPDREYFTDRRADDGCNYDSDNDGAADRNWAVEWQTSHTEGTDWYNCSSAHSQPLNANQKAYAAWWLWARLAGWSGK